MFRFSIALSLFLILVIPDSVFSQTPSAERSWVQQELIKIKVFPFRDKAYQYLREDKLTEAAAEFAKVMEIDPADSESRLDYCQILYDVGDYEAASRQAFEVLKRLPANSQALMLGAVSLQRVGRKAEALSLLLEALDRGGLDQPTTNDAVINAVSLLIEQKDYDRALEFLGGHGLSLSPARRSFVSGLAYKGIGSLVKARAAFEQALLVTGEATLPRESRLVALSDLADILMQANKPKEARARLMEAFVINSDLPLVTYRLASLAYEEKQYGDALQWIDSSLEQEQTSIQLQLKAFILVELGRREEAFMLFDNLIEVAGSDARKTRLLTQKGHVAMKLGDSNSAAEAFEQVLEIMPDVETMQNLATAQSAGDNWTKAAETYELMLSMLEPGSVMARTRLQLGTAYMKAGRSSRAVHELSKALDSGLLSQKDRIYTVENIAFLYYGNSQYIAAKKAFLSVLAEQPDNRRILLALGRTQLRMGEYENAAGSFRRLDIQKQEYQVSMLLADAYEKGGRSDQAMHVYRAIMDSGLIRGERAMTVLERMATFESRNGRPAKAGELYVKAFSVAVQKNASLLLRAGESFLAAQKYDKALRTLEQYIDKSSGADNFEVLSMMGVILSEQGRMDEAAEVYRRVFRRADLTLEQRGRLLVNLGYISLALNNVDSGIEYMRLAILEGGETSQLRLDIGQVLYRAGRYIESMQEVRCAKKLGAGYEADLALVFCYEKLNKPGLALYYMKEAKRTAPESVLENSAEFYDQLAYLYLSEKSYPEAVFNYQKSLNIAPTPLGAYRLGRAQRLAGRLEMAEKTLLSVNSALLDVPTRARFYEELGRVSMGLEFFDRAQMYYRKAIEEVANSERLYLLGQAQEEAKDVDEAINSYLRALEMNFFDSYLASLGYAYYRNNNLEDAASIFANLQQRDPDYIKLVEDLAYINKRLYRNDASIDLFKKSIDNAPFYPNETATSLRKKVYGFKEEVRGLTNRWDITGFYSYSPSEDDFFTDVQGVQTGVLENSAGVEVGYIPKNFGFRNGKIFQIIGRVSIPRTEDGVFNFNADTLQGAIGLRYKPFSAANVAFGVERLFKIGDKAEENTLLRALGAWDDGWSMRASERHWNYTFLFGEVDQYLEDDKRTVFIAHGRQGRTWNVNDEWLISPHVYLTYKKNSSDRYNTSHVEGGPALSIRWLEGEDEYVSYKREWEILLRYSFGKHLEGDYGHFTGLCVNLRLNF